jgi:C4-dicarboxylate-binding protein DctP
MSAGEAAEADAIAYGFGRAGMHRGRRRIGRLNLARVCIALTAGLLALAAGTGLVAAAEKSRLRVTMQLPLSSHLGVNLLEFTKEIEARTEGAISFEISDGGKLYPEAKLVEVVSSGAIEMAIIGFNQFSAKAPAMDVVQQPFLLNYDKLVRAALSADSELRAIIDRSILESTGVRPLWWQGYGSTVFFTRGGDAADPSQIKGRKVRVLGEVMADMVKHCGGEPVILSAAAMTKAMKDGQVDMIMVGASSVEPRGLWQVSDTITRTEHAALEFVVVINEGVWQKLTESQRQAMTEVAREVEVRLRQKMAAVDEAAYAFARSKAMTIRSLTPDETAQWRACSAPVLEAYIAHPADSVREVLAAYGRLRTKPCCTEGPTVGLLFTRR